METTLIEAVSDLELQQNPHEPGSILRSVWRTAFIAGAIACEAVLDDCSQPVT